MTTPTIHEITTSGDYCLYTTARAQGYVSRKCEGRVEEYAGRYGKGFKIHYPAWDSTRYHHVEYWIAIFDR